MWHSTRRQYPMPYFYDEDRWMTENELDILELLIRYKLEIMRLYEVFASLFPDRQVCWQSLAKDEQRHADWLGALQSGAGLESWLQQNVQLKPQGLKIFIRTQQGFERLKYLSRCIIRLLAAIAAHGYDEPIVNRKRFWRLG
jgi:hypothetical protein